MAGHHAKTVWFVVLGTAGPANRGAQRGNPRSDEVLTFQQTFIVAHDEVAVNFLHQIKHDAHGNQQAGSSVKTSLIVAMRSPSAWGSKGKDSPRMKPNGTSSALPM